MAPALNVDIVLFECDETRSTYSNNHLHFVKTHNYLSIYFTEQRRERKEHEKYKEDSNMIIT